MTTRTDADPVAKLERLYVNRTDALLRAEEYDARGWSYMAKYARRQAAGYKAAYTRLSRMYYGEESHSDHWLIENSRGEGTQ